MVTVRLDWQARMHPAFGDGRFFLIISSFGAWRGGVSGFKKIGRLVSDGKVTGSFL